MLKSQCLCWNVKTIQTFLSKHAHTNQIHLWHGMYKYWNLRNQIYWLIPKCLGNYKSYKTDKIKFSRLQDYNHQTHFNQIGLLILKRYGMSKEDGVGG